MIFLTGIDKYYRLSNKKLEILGNKFDNPELLKGE